MYHALHYCIIMVSQSCFIKLNNNKWC